MLGSRWDCTDVPVCAGGGIRTLYSYAAVRSDRPSAERTMIDAEWISRWEVQYPATSDDVLTAE
jgi:hypothetical protein